MLSELRYNCSKTMHIILRDDITATKPTQSLDDAIAWQTLNASLTSSSTSSNTNQSAKWVIYIIWLTGSTRLKHLHVDEHNIPLGTIWSFEFSQQVTELILWGLNENTVVHTYLSLRNARIPMRPGQQQEWGWWARLPMVHGIQPNQQI